MTTVAEMAMIISARDHASGAFNSASGSARRLDHAVDGVDRSSARFGATSGRTAGALTRLKGVMAGVAVGAGYLAVRFAVDSVKAYADAEKQQLKLQDAYKRFPKMADVSIDSLRGLNAEMQKKTRFDGDDLAAMQASLAMFKLTGSQVRTLTPLVADFAARSGKGIVASGTLIGKALLGNARALKEIGVNYKSTGNAAQDFGNIVAILTTKVGGFAAGADAQTADAKMAMLRNAFEDVQETIGEALMPTLVKLTDLMEENLPKIAAAAEAMAPVIEDSFGRIGAMFDIVAGSVQKLADVWNAIPEPLRKLMTVGFQLGFSMMPQTLGLNLDALSRGLPDSGDKQTVEVAPKLTDIPPFLRSLDTIKKLTDAKIPKTKDVKVGTTGAPRAKADLDGVGKSANALGGKKPKVSTSAPGAIVTKALLSAAAGAAIVLGGKKPKVNTSAPGAKGSKGDLDKVTAAAGTAGRQRPKVITSAPGAGLSKTGLEAVTTAAGLIPPFKTIMVIADALPAVAVIESFVNWAMRTLSWLGVVIGGGGGGSEPHVGGGGSTVSAAAGGRVRGPGTSTSDSVAIRASAGEWVIRADAVERYGHPAMAAINEGRADVGFARGGRIPASTGSSDFEWSTRWQRRHPKRRREPLSDYKARVREALEARWGETDEGVSSLRGGAFSGIETVSAFAGLGSFDVDAARETRDALADAAAAVSSAGTEGERATAQRAYTAAKKRADAAAITPANITAWIQKKLATMAQFSSALTGLAKAGADPVTLSEIAAMGPDAGLLMAKALTGKSTIRDLARLQSQIMTLGAGFGAARFTAGLGAEADRASIVDQVIRGQGGSVRVGLDLYIDGVQIHDSLLRLKRKRGGKSLGL